MPGRWSLSRHVSGLFSANLNVEPLKGNGDKNFYSSHLNETPKLYIEIYYRILTPALFRDIF